jgi:hypothetical protein
MNECIYVHGSELIPGDVLTGKIKFLNPPPRKADISYVRDYANVMIISSQHSDLFGLTVMLPNGEVCHRWYNASGSQHERYEVFRDVEVCHS